MSDAYVQGVIFNLMSRGLYDFDLSWWYFGGKMLGTTSKILYELSEHLYVVSYNNLMEQMLLHWEVITHSG